MDDTRVDFLFNLYFVGRKIKGHYKQENKDLMLSSAILHLLQKKEYTLSDLARIMYSKLSSFSEKISIMEQEGLVKKIEKKEDEREQYISLTIEGKKRVEKTIKSMELHCMDFVGGITDEDLKKINPILKKIIS